MQASAPTLTTPFSISSSDSRGVSETALEQPDPAVVPPTQESLTDDLTAQLTKCCASDLRTLSWTAAEAAQAFARSLRGNSLDLTVDERLSYLAHALPREAWTLLDTLSRTVSRAPISELVLRTRKLSAALDRGVSGLPGLKCLQLQVSNCRTLNLTGLNSTTLETILIDPPRKPLRILAREGIQLRSSRRTYSPFKASVQFYGSDGKLLGKARALHGLIYNRVTGDSKSPKEALQLALASEELNLNGVARFKESDCKSAGLPAGQAIVCRHLTAHWLQLRDRYDPERNASENPGPMSKSTPPRFSLDSVRDTDAITRNVSVSTESLFRALDKDRPVAIFDTAHLGHVLAEQLVRLGETKHRRAAFALRTAEHLMGLEIAIKPRKGPQGREENEHVVTLYDPNRSVIHRRLVVATPSDLEGRGFQDWIGTKHEKAYFSDLEEPFCMLLRWPPGSADMNAPSLRASPRALRAEQFLGIALKLDNVELLTAAIRHQDDKALMAQFVAAQTLRYRSPRGSEVDFKGELGLNKAILRHEGISSLDRARLLRSVDSDKLETPLGTPYGAAMQRGEVGFVRDFASSVLHSGAALTRVDRAAILRGSDTETTALHRALTQGHGAAATAYVEVIADRKTGQLQVQDELPLLLGADPRIDHGNPALFRIAAHRTAGATQRQRQHLALYQLTQALVKLPTLELGLKAKLCAATSEKAGCTAAQAALKAGNPGAAAAIACGIVESALQEADKKALLASLKVSCADILRALDRTPEDGTEWEDRLQRFAQASDDTPQQARASAAPDGFLERLKRWRPRTRGAAPLGNGSGDVKSSAAP